MCKCCSENKICNVSYTKIIFYKFSKIELRLQRKGSNFVLMLRNIKRNNLKGRKYLVYLWDDGSVWKMNICFRKGFRSDANIYDREYIILMLHLSSLVLLIQYRVPSMSRIQINRSSKRSCEEYKYYYKFSENDKRYYMIHIMWYNIPGPRHHSLSLPTSITGASQITFAFHLKSNKLLS